MSLYNSGLVLSYMATCMDLSGKKESYDHIESTLFFNVNTLYYLN